MLNVCVSKTPFPLHYIIHHSTLGSICRACNTVASSIRERAGQPIYEFHFWRCGILFARQSVRVLVTLCVSVCVCCPFIHPCPVLVICSLIMQISVDFSICSVNANADIVFIFDILYIVYSACDDIMNARTHTHTSALGICMRLDLIFHRIAF